jgi:hypothetical protein
LVQKIKVKQFLYRPVKGTGGSRRLRFQDFEIMKNLSHPKWN